MQASCTHIHIDYIHVELFCQATAVPRFDVVPPWRMKQLKREDADTGDDVAWPEQWQHFKPQQLHVPRVVPPPPRPPHDGDASAGSSHFCPPSVLPCPRPPPTPPPTSVLLAAATSSSSRASSSQPLKKVKRELTEERFPLVNVKTLDRDDDDADELSDCTPEM